MSINSDEGIAIINKVGDLSAMPAIAMDVMGMLNDPSSTVKGIVDKIRLDQAMVSYILRNCNSPLYGIRTEVTSVNRAITLLGFSTLKSILMAYFMRNLYQLSGKNQIKEKLWKHSVAVAVFSRNLAARLKVNLDHEEVYIAGLLHDIGKIVLYLDESEKYQEIINRVEAGEANFLDIEKQLLKFTHVDIGYLLLTKWKFSRLLIDVVFHHHDPEWINDAEAPVVTLVAFADSLSHHFFENRPENLDPFLKYYNINAGQLEKITQESITAIEEFYSIL